MTGADHLVDAGAGSGRLRQLGADDDLPDTADAGLRLGDVEQVLGWPALVEPASTPAIWLASSLE
jgi:hypothetical protein